MTSIKKNLFHNTLFLLSNLLFPLISFSYASRVLGPEAYGKVQFVLVFAQYFVLLAALGIPIFGVREIAKIRNNRIEKSKVLSELIIINIISSVAILLLYLIIILTVPKFQIDIKLYLLGGLIVLSAFSNLDWFYNGVEQFRFLSIRSITIKLLSLIALFLFVKTKDDLILYFLVVIFSILANNIWNVFGIRRLISFRLYELNFKRHIPALLTLLGTSISISIYSVIDTLLLGFLAGDIAVGYYSAAVKINKIAIPVVTVLGTVLIPQITQCLENNDREHLDQLLNKSFSFICLIGIPMAFGLFLFAQEFISSISGSGFAAATLTMKITAPLALVVGYAHLFGFQLLIPAGLERKYLVATTVGMTLSILLNFLLIGSMKDKGAAIATISSEILVTVLSGYFAYKYIKMDLDWSMAVKALFSCLFFIPIAWLLRRQFDETIIRLIIAIPFAALVYFLIQTIAFKNPLMKEAIVFVRKKGWSPNRSGN